MFGDKGNEWYLRRGSSGTCGTRGLKGEQSLRVCGGGMLRVRMGLWAIPEGVAGVLGGGWYVDLIRPPQQQELSLGEK